MSDRSWQQSFSGNVITPRDLRPEQVRFEDIGHALAQKIRFNGQCTVMGYTVAQHCVLGSMMVPPALGLPFLLHEIDEVFLPDIPSPLKKFVRVELPDKALCTWDELCGKHRASILYAIGLLPLCELIDAPEVKEADLRMLMTEKRDLMGPEPKPWGFNEKPYDFTITDIWEPIYAEKRFNDRYRRLLNTTYSTLRGVKR